MSVRTHRRRAADAPWVESVTHVTYDGDFEDVTRPDGCWDLVVLKRSEGLLVLQTGLITQPVRLPHQAGDEYLCISFKPGVFVPGMSADGMVDQGVVRPLTNARSFALGRESLEIPTFENAEGLVQQLVRRGLLARDEIVQRAVDGDAVFTTDRSVQRHFLRSLGIPFKALEQIRRALAGEALYTHTEVNGAVLEGWMAPLRDSEGRVTGAIGISTDVTERFQAQQRMYRSERMAAMGTLVASVAHELNNPLAYMQEGLRNTERELDAGQLSPARLRQLLADLREGTERLRVITSDLQTFSRRDALTDLVDLKRVAQAALKLLGTQLTGKAALQLELADGVWVRASEPRLIQVFVNLLLNAAQALGDRPGPHVIGLEVRRDGGDAVVVVTDSGAGIAPELGDRIFEPFVTSKPIGEGTGLGLFVCRNVIHALSGTIESENGPVRGAVFRVRLPAAEAEAAGTGGAASSASGPARRVLIIDDNVNLGRVMGEALTQMGCVTRVLTSGREAVELLAGGAAFDLVLCDLMMNDLSGMEVYAQLAQRRPGLEASLVFMTGGAFTEAARRFLDAVPNRRLQKPFDVCDQVTRLLG